MNTYTFVKKNGGWHVDLPQHNRNEKSAAELIMRHGAETMLNLMSEGEGRVVLALNTEPFENASSMELLQICQPFLEGGYYSLREFEGKQINYKIWLCDVPKYVFGNFPEKIYVRREKEEKAMSSQLTDQD